MSKAVLSHPFVRRSLLLTALFGTSVVALSAQMQPSTGAVEPIQVQTPRFDVASDSLFSSSSAENADATPLQTASLTRPIAFAQNMQYGGRRYGRPRYRGANTNADGSSKYDFFAGAGFTAAVGNTHRYLDTSYGFQVGGGRQFNKNFAMNVQFDYDNFGINDNTLTRQLDLYNTSIAYYNAGQTADNQITPLTSLNGNSHVWSFTLDPTYSLGNGTGLGGYVVGGVGFYHKVANFTVPATSEYCDPYYGCYEYEANQNIDHYTSNAPGVNGGFGITYKFSRFSNERLYGEVRYVYIFNSQRQGLTIDNITQANAGETNDYPANSNRTSYIPVRFGIRF